jgi:hypothetical protein
MSTVKDAHQRFTFATFGCFVLANWWRLADLPQTLDNE